MQCMSGVQAASQADLMKLRRLAQLLPRYQYCHGSEVQLHEGIAKVLLDAQIEHEREVVAGPRDRFDFLVPDGIVMECKIKGSLPEALRQVDRYAARHDVLAVLLVTTRHWRPSIAAGLQLHGKPVWLVNVRGAAF